MKTLVLVTVDCGDVKATTAFGDDPISVIIVDFDKLVNEDTSKFGANVVRRIMDNYDGPEAPDEAVSDVIARITAIGQDIDDANIDDMLDDDEDFEDGIWDADDGDSGLERDFDEFDDDDDYDGDDYYRLDEMNLGNDFYHNDQGDGPRWGDEPNPARWTGAFVPRHDDQQARDFVEVMNATPSREVRLGETIYGDIDWDKLVNAANHLPEDYNANALIPNSDPSIIDPRD